MSAPEAPPAVIAKFRCTNIQHAYTGNAQNSASTVTLVPVWEQDGVNRKWSQATPSGKLEMLITVPETVDNLELGRRYKLLLIPDED